MISIGTRRRGMPRDLRQAQEVTADVSTSNQTFPEFFILNESANSSHRRVELRVATHVQFEGMVQRVLQVDVNSSRLSVLSYPQRAVLDSFELSHLVQTDYPEDLIIRLILRQSSGGFLSSLLQGKAFAGKEEEDGGGGEGGGEDGEGDPTQTKKKKKKKEVIWAKTFHTMSAAQRDYFGALLQGLVGLARPLNAKNQILCSPSMIKVGRERFSIWVGSWNMGNKPAPDFTPARHGVSPSVRPWLLLDGGREYDFYVAGIQEMDATVFSMIDQQIGPDYYLLTKVTMGAIALVVYIRKRLLAHVRDVETVTTATGFAGVGTNKGFVAAALSYLGQPLLFINCHLAARDDASRLRQRVRQYKIAIKKLRLGKLPGSDVLHQFNVWFFGDMNFRVCATDRDAWPNSGRTRREVIETLYGARSPEDYRARVARLYAEGDQLNMEKALGTIFAGFKERPIDFSPTYKYEAIPKSATWESVKDGAGKIVGHQVRDLPSTEFSRRRAQEDLGQNAGELVTGYYVSCRQGAHRREYTDHKEQVPSWCDRVLHRTLPHVNVEQTSYQCCDDVMTSDHSPVSATFNVDVPQPPSAYPSAAFHVGAIQILRAEVYCFRHPRTPIERFYNISTDGTTAGPSGGVGGGVGGGGGGGGGIPPPLPGGRAAGSTPINLHKGPANNVRASFDGLDEEDDMVDPATPVRSRGEHLLRAHGVATTPGSADSRQAGKRRRDGGGGGRGSLSESGPASSSGGGETGSIYDTDEEAEEGPEGEDDAEGERGEGEGNFFKQVALACAFPFMKDASTRSRVTSRLAPHLGENSHTWRPGCTLEPGLFPEYVFTGRELVNVAVGPFLTTREHLQSQWFILHLLPRSYSETRESLGSCVVSLADACEGRTINFEAALERSGQHCGFVRGRYRVWLDGNGWDEEHVSKPASHWLAPKRLTANYVGAPPPQVPSFNNSITSTLIATSLVSSSSLTPAAGSATGSSTLNNNTIGSTGASASAGSGGDSWIGATSVVSVSGSTITATTTTVANSSGGEFLRRRHSPPPENREWKWKIRGGEDVGDDGLGASSGEVVSYGILRPPLPVLLPGNRPSQFTAASGFRCSYLIGPGYGVAPTSNSVGGGSFAGEIGGDLRPAQGEDEGGEGEDDDVPRPEGLGGTIAAPTPLGGVARKETARTVVSADDPAEEEEEALVRGNAAANAGTSVSSFQLTEKRVRTPRRRKKQLGSGASARNNGSGAAKGRLRKSLKAKMFGGGGGAGGEPKE